MVISTSYSSSCRNDAALQQEQ